MRAIPHKRTLCGSPQLAMLSGVGGQRSERGSLWPAIPQPPQTAAPRCQRHRVVQKDLMKDYCHLDTMHQPSISQWEDVKTEPKYLLKRLRIDFGDVGLFPVGCVKS